MQCYDIFNLSEYRNNFTFTYIEYVKVYNNLLCVFNENKNAIIYLMNPLFLSENF